MIAAHRPGRLGGRALAARLAPFFELAIEL